jgi:hypothetical protein
VANQSASSPAFDDHERHVIVEPAACPVHVVSKRLGHSRVKITLNIYVQVLPDMQQAGLHDGGAALSDPP